MREGSTLPFHNPAVSGRTRLALSQVKGQQYYCRYYCCSDQAHRQATPSSLAGMRRRRRITAHRRTFLRAWALMPLNRFLLSRLCTTGMDMMSVLLRDQRSSLRLCNSATILNQPTICVERYLVEQTKSTAARAMGHPRRRGHGTPSTRSPPWRRRPC